MTERGRAREATREPFAALFRALPMPAWVYDEATLQIVEVNEAAVQLYGYRREELLGMRLPDIEPAARASAAAGTYESDHLARTGRLIEVEVHSEPTTWDGRPARVATVTDLTGRRDATRSLAAGQSLVADLVAAAHEAILTVDERLVVTSMNPSAAAMFRVDAAMAVGESFERFIPAPYREDYRAMIMSWGTAAPGADAPVMEMLLRRADGDAFVGEAGIARSDHDGRTYIAIVLRDTTQQRQAAAALRDSERRYQLLASVAPVGIFRLDGEGRCIYANERLGTMSGRRASHLLGLGWAAVVHPDDRRIVLEEWSRALRAKQAFHAEVRIAGPGGRARWALISARAEEDEEGAVRSYVGTVIDITRRRAAETALRESEALYHTLASVAPVGIFRLNLEGECTFANERAVEISGRDGVGIRLADWDTCVHRPDRERVAKAWQTALRTGEPYRQAFRLLRPNGTQVRVLAAMVPERDERGRVTGFLGTLTDLTRARLDS